MMNLFSKKKSTALRIGLTGGIGAGKSTVSKRLAALGAVVLDADEISRAALSKDGACLRQTAEAFPSAYSAQREEMDRKALAEIVFSDREARLRLNAIVHPAVIARMNELADAVERANPRALIVFDAPLLFECNMQRSMNGVIVVAADEEKRIERIMKRDGLTRCQALDRIHSQMSQEEKLARADYAILNNGSERLLYEQVDALYAALTEGNE